MIWTGVDYYPEHWDCALWEQDARLMKQSGVNIVRMAEFAWSRMQPEEGKFTMAWLDKAVDLMAEQGIKVVLGIPTMTPPPWATQRYPDILPILPGQHLSQPGVRGHRCYNSPSMRRLTRLITERMAKRYARHEAVIGWQTDNEFSLHMCRCSHCKQAFHMWLRDKYGNLERINAEWGMVVWSGEFTDWEQIQLYETNERYMNPSLLLDYRRFQSDSVADYQQIQVKVIREHCPDHFITHNTWSAPLPLDHAKLYDPLDFASFDYYPASSPGKTDTNPYSGALLLDRTRGFKQGRGFWVMEQFGGMPGSWMPMWRSPHPGFLRAFAWQSIARGADGVVFFRWRSAVAGAEQFWHGLIDHSNVPGRRFREFQQFCHEVQGLSEQLDGTKVYSKAAIYYDFDSHTALQLQPQSAGMDYYENLKVMHRAMLKLGIQVDIVHQLNETMNQYALLVLPSLFVADEQTAQLLENYVVSGGTLVATPRTGCKQTNNQCHMAMLPGPLAACFGVEVVEYDPLGSEDTSWIVDVAGTRYYTSQWNDVLRPTTANVMAYYDSEYYKGEPAVSCNDLGEGQAIYVGSFPEEQFYSDLFRSLAEARGIAYFANLPVGLQVSRRTEGDRELLFLLNLSRERQSLNLPLPMQRLLGSGIVGKKLTVEPYAVEILTLCEPKG